MDSLPGTSLSSSGSFIGTPRSIGSYGDDAGFFPEDYLPELSASAPQNAGDSAIMGAPETRASTHSVSSRESVDSRSRASSVDSTSRRNSVADIESRASDSSALVALKWFGRGAAKVAGVILVVLGGISSAVPKFFSKGPMHIGRVGGVGVGALLTEGKQDDESTRTRIKHKFRGALVPTILTSPLALCDAIASVFGKMGIGFLKLGGIDPEKLKGTEKYFKTSVGTMYEAYTDVIKPIRAAEEVEKLKKQT